MPDEQEAQTTPPTDPAKSVPRKYAVLGAPNGHDSELVERRPERVSNIDLWEQIVRAREEGLNTRGEILSLRQDFGQLELHVNHEVEQLREIIDGKLSADQLLTSLGFKLLNNRWARWVAGLALTSVVATAVRNEWYPWIVQFLQLVQRLLT